MLKIQLTKKAQKFLKRVLPKHARQLKEKIQALQHNPQPNDSKQLIGYSFYRVDVGEYRIIYRVEQAILFIFLIGKRNDNDVYKRIKR